MRAQGKETARSEVDGKMEQKVVKLKHKHGGREEAGAGSQL